MTLPQKWKEKCLPQGWLAGLSELSMEGAWKPARGRPGLHYLLVNLIPLELSSSCGLILTKV